MNHNKTFLKPNLNWISKNMCFLYWRRFYVLKPSICWILLNSQDFSNLLCYSLFKMNLNENCSTKGGVSIPSLFLDCVITYCLSLTFFNIFHLKGYLDSCAVLWNHWNIINQYYSAFKISNSFFISNNSQIISHFLLDSRCSGSVC